MMKKLWIVGNWKSNKTIMEALTWVAHVGSNLQPHDLIKVAVCPPYICLADMKKTIQVSGYPLALGAQNLSPFGLGSFTGEIAAQQLQELVELSILGHSERRNHFGETDGQIAQKIMAANEAGIMPLLCVQDQHTPIPDEVRVVAYEPVFAIGTGTPDTPSNANLVAGQIKQAHPQVEILYGGSVKSDNAKGFLEQEHLSGLLIGASSLNPEEFLKIIQIAYSLS